MSDTPIKVMGVTIYHGDRVLFGGIAGGNPCLTCRHWNHIQGRTLGVCTSDNPSEKAEGFLYTDSQTCRPCWEGML